MFFFEEAEINEMNAEELRNKLADLKNQQKTAEARMDFADEGTEPVNREQLRDDIEKILSDIAYIEERLQLLKTFKKEVFIRNLRDLLKKSPNVKISQIETEANCSPGYLSRLDKEGNTTDPSIEFIATAARLLDVSIDFLLTGTVEELSQTESFLVEFISSVIEDTAADEIVWKVDERPAEEYTSGSRYPEEIGHPLFSSRGDSGSHFTVYYASKFENEVHTVAGAYSYVGTLPHSSDRMYVMACAKKTSTEQDKSDTFIECYLETNECVSPLCSSHIACETLSKKITDLYKEIGKSAKRIHISNDAIAAISKYMKNRIPEELPFS